MPLSPWRLQPSQRATLGIMEAAPRSTAIDVGSPWAGGPGDAVRGTALHLALRTCLTRPDRRAALGAATGLSDTLLDQVAERAAALKGWLEQQGYTELHCEVPVLGHTAAGAEIPGTLDLLALGPQGGLLIDHKSGGPGAGFGSYWPQLSAYAGLIARHWPEHPLQGVAVFWIDHGRLELARLPVAVAG